MKVSCFLNPRQRFLFFITGNVIPARSESTSLTEHYLKLQNVILHNFTVKDDDLAFLFLESSLATLSFTLSFYFYSIFFLSHKFGFLVYGTPLERYRQSYRGCQRREKKKSGVSSLLPRKYHGINIDELYPGKTSLFIYSAQGF